jgi:NADP-dependent 3-hydroxy acid dehydrogenase YdfG
MRLVREHCHGDRSQRGGPGPPPYLLSTLPFMSATSSVDGSPEPQVCVVTGVNSGIGRATAVHLAESGYTVFGTVRSLSKADKLNAAAAAAGVVVELIEMDIADDGSVSAGLAAILDRVGRATIS